MTVEPGFGGQKFIADMLPKIREARELMTRRGRNIDIEIDGGVTRDNIGTILRAGANVIVAGSAVYHGNVEENTRFFIQKLRGEEA